MDPSHWQRGDREAMVSFHRQNTNMLTNPFVTASVSPSEIAEERYCRHNHYSSLFYTALLGSDPRRLLDKTEKYWRSSKQQHTHLER